MRKAEISRKTTETKITVSVDLDGAGRYDVQTGIGFLDHMLEQLSRHSLMDLTVRAEGDTHIDLHHTTEDVGIALGQAIGKALGDRKGITRYASIDLPMDEACTRAAVDVSGRPHLVWQVTFERPKVGDFDTELFQRVLSGAGPELRASRCTSSTSMARTTTTSPRPASRRWRGCFALPSRSIPATPRRSPPPRARSPDRTPAMRYYTVHAPAARADRAGALRLRQGRLLLAGVVRADPLDPLAPAVAGADLVRRLRAGRRLDRAARQRDERRRSSACSAPCSSRWRPTTSAACRSPTAAGTRSAASFGRDLDGGGDRASSPNGTGLSPAASRRPARGDGCAPPTCRSAGPTRRRADPRPLPGAGA